MKKISVLFFTILISASGVCVQGQERRSNPIVSHMFTADASAHVWQDGRLYVYPSTDVAPARGYKTMDGYHVFSTDDMITWKDHGEILHSRDVSWGIEGGGYMWAPDCVYKNGTYYFYFPHKNKEGVWEIGVATSDKPASGFKVKGYVKGGNTFCDPCVFIDDDGQAYLYAVVDAKTFAAKLKDNMMEIEGDMVLQSCLKGHREGPFVVKRDGMYYIIYPDDFPKFNKMRYSMSDSPLGPWNCKGVFVDHTDVITMHGSLVEYKGQWYLFYHNGSLSGGVGPLRSICFDPVYFNEDGTIQMVEQTLGVQLPTFHDDINFNGMFGTLPVGEYDWVEMQEHGIVPNAVSSIQIPEGYVLDCFDGDAFTGKHWRFEEDRIDLGALGCSDLISSIKVSKSEVVNLVRNPSFELATLEQVKFWGGRSTQSYKRYRDDSAKGYYSLRYSGKKGANEFVQKVRVTPNTNYGMRVSMRVESGSEGEVLFRASGKGEDVCLFNLDAEDKAGEWVEFEASFNSGDSSELQLLCLTSPEFSGACYWDDVTLKVN